MNLEKRKELHTRKSPSFHRPEHNLRLPRYAPKAQPWQAILSRTTQQTGGE